jgi:hypothetical protein
VEWNVYFDGQRTMPLGDLEWEDFEFIEAPMASRNLVQDPAQCQQDDNPSDKASIEPVPQISTLEPHMSVPEVISHDVPYKCHVHKPSQHIQNLISSRASYSNHQTDPVLAQGIQASTQPALVEQAVLEGEGSAEQIMVMTEDEFEDLAEEVAMVMATFEAEELNPTLLVDAKCHPDWLD